MKKWEIFFCFVYLSAVWLLFGQNPIGIIVDKIFVLDFAKIVTKQLINKQKWKFFSHFSKYWILFLLPISCIAGEAKCVKNDFRRNENVYSFIINFSNKKYTFTNFTVPAHYNTTRSSRKLQKGTYKLMMSKVVNCLFRNSKNWRIDCL